MVSEYLCPMEQICFLSDFPASGEEKFYEKIETRATEDYTLYVGGTYVHFKNKKGLTVRFTSADVKGRKVSDEQVAAWLKRLHQLHAHF